MTYAAIHQRLALKARGACAHCGKPAKEWALKQDASHRLSDSAGRYFSTSENDYEPLCVKCHRQGDGNAQTMWDRHYDYLVSTRARGANHVGSAKLTLEQVNEIKRRRNAGETGRALAEAFGVSEGIVSMIASGKLWAEKLKHNQQLAFTLIELLIVVAIIGILAAIAIPQYQTFVTRGKVSELLLALSSCRTSVSEYRITQAAWPADIDAAGCSDQQTKYVSTLKVGANGVITATALTGANAIDPAAAGDLELRPTLTAGGEIDWSCKGPGTTIPAKYLPANCRP